MAVQMIDINCDMGEAYGYWKLGDSADEDLMKFITSANIATGFHAGDPNLMNRSVELATQHGVAIGAHPGYNDLQGFGRRKITARSSELVNDIIYQVGALREFAAKHRASLQHVKPHGALYMEMATNTELAEHFLGFMRNSAPETFVFCMGNSAFHEVAKRVGQPVVREFFADRDYDGSGSIVFIRQAKKLSPKKIADKVLQACQDGTVTTVDGVDIDIKFESICCHSDTPGCLKLVKTFRQALMDNGIKIAPVSEFIN